ncbi:CAP domain-containing protein [Patescibacteria group bacterium]
MITHTLRHVFVPHRSNNHRARLLHPQILFLLTAFLIIFQFVLNGVGSSVGILGYAANISPTEVIALSNVKRAEVGAPSLNYSQELTNAARSKGEHMLSQNYWAHVAPDGTEPWKFFTDSGYVYKYAGENLARDFSNPESAVNAWMASPTHKDNLLSSKYSDIGIAVVEGDLGGVDTTIIVQMFGTRLSSGTESVPVAKAQESNSINTTPAVEITPQTPVAAIIPTSTSADPTTTSTPSPTGPTQVPEPTRATAMVASGEDVSGGGYVISPFMTTRNISLIVTITLIGVLLLDAAYIAYKKVPRIHGKTLAHLSFLGMVLVIALVAKAGNIL